MALATLCALTVSHHGPHKLRGGQGHRVVISSGLFENLLAQFPRRQCSFRWRRDRVSVSIVHDNQVVKCIASVSMLVVSCGCQVLVVGLLAIKCCVIRERCLLNLCACEPFVRIGFLFA